MIDRGSLVLGAGVVVASSAWVAAYLLADLRGTVAGLVMLTPAVVVSAGTAGRWEHRPSVWPPALIPLVAGTVVFVVTAGVDLALGAVLGLGLLLSGPWSVGRWLQARAELVDAGWRTAAVWEDRAQDIEKDARVRERERLAGQMHDLVGHDLARAALALGGLELDPGLSPEVRGAVGRARAHVSTAAERLADAVTAVDPISSTGSAVELVGLVEGVRADGRQVTLVPADPSPLLADVLPQVTDLLIRAVREGLTNAVKHTEEAPVEVSVARRSTSAAVVVRTRGADRSTASGPGSGRGLRALRDEVQALGGAVEHGPSGRDHLLTVRVPLRPGTADAELPGVHGARRAAIQHVRRSRMLAVRGTAAVIAVSLLLAAGYRVVDVATSVLPAATFGALQIGEPRVAIVDELPWRTRTDATGIAPPPGSLCEHYSATADLLSADLYRLCWTGGRLSTKDLIRRSSTAPGTIGT
jgi:signal transduction histidine kinase